MKKEKIKNDVKSFNTFATVVLTILTVITLLPIILIVIWTVFAVEMLFPRIEVAALSPGGFNYLSEPPVAPCEYALEKACPRHVP